MIRVTDRVQRLRMSWEDYLRLPEGVRAEYVDGEVIVNAQPRSGHNRASYRLANAIEAALDPGLDVVTASGYHNGTKVRVPDIAVYPEIEDVSLYEQTPILLAEVLSPSTRTEDMLRKPSEYAQAGVGQYWVLDRDNRTLTIMTNNGGGWDLLLELDDQQPTGEVVVGDHGTVPLDLDALIGPRPRAEPPQR